MDESGTSEIEAARDAILQAARQEVIFDGWGPKTFRRAVDLSGVDPGLADLACPRGSLDLALAYHDGKDAELARWLEDTPLTHLRYSERVARAVEKRLELVADDRELVRRSAAFFALPQNAAEGARRVWRTADTIWVGLGDTSRDLNYYTKRATLSAVYSSALLFWLGDQTEGFAATRGFIARRIDDVMRFEKVKSQLTSNPIAKAMTENPIAKAMGEMAQRAGEKMRPPSGLPGNLDDMFRRRN